LWLLDLHVDQFRSMTFMCSQKYDFLRHVLTMTSLFQCSMLIKIVWHFPSTWWSYLQVVDFQTSKMHMLHVISSWLIHWSITWWCTIGHSFILDNEFNMFNQSHVSNLMGMLLVEALFTM
jgi:hypothetical protein